MSEAEAVEHSEVVDDVKKNTKRKNREVDDIEEVEHEEKDRDVDDNEEEDQGRKGGSSPAARSSGGVDVGPKGPRHSPEQLRCEGGGMPLPTECEKPGRPPASADSGAAVAQTLRRQPVGRS